MKGSCEQSTCGERWWLLDQSQYGIIVAFDCKICGGFHYLSNARTLLSVVNFRLHILFTKALSSTLCDVLNVSMPLEVVQPISSWDQEPYLDLEFWSLAGGKDARYVGADAQHTRSRRELGKN
jgi:hypothetical protein